MEKRRIAWWSISLYTECPSCEGIVDLVEGDDFWEDASFFAGEHDTYHTRNVLVKCPDCEHEFRVDFVY